MTCHALARSLKGFFMDGDACVRFIRSLHLAEDSSSQNCHVCRCRAASIGHHSSFLDKTKSNLSENKGFLFLRCTSENKDQ